MIERETDPDQSPQLQGSGGDIVSTCVAVQDRPPGENGDISSSGIEETEPDVHKRLVSDITVQRAADGSIDHVD